MHSTRRVALLTGATGLALLFLLPSCSFSRALRDTRRSAYELDDRVRSSPPEGEKHVCDTTELVSYRGLVLRYDAPVLAHPAFVERLIRFERVVRELGLEIYGRAPRVLHQAGAFSCRTTVTGQRWSEHALGNALDIEGFSFDALDKAAAERLRTRGVELEPASRRAFRLHVGDTWRPTARAIDKRFFTVLLDRLRSRDDVFRAIIGPPDPAHLAHLHLDVGPWAFGRFALP